MKSCDVAMDISWLVNIRYPLEQNDHIQLGRTIEKTAYSGLSKLTWQLLIIFLLVSNGESIGETSKNVSKS